MDWSRHLHTTGRALRSAKDFIKARMGSAVASLLGSTTAPETGQLLTVAAFGDNPGRLRMRLYLPPVVPGRPLVVLLHGCGQDAATFAAASGWMEMADRLGFPLVLPEQVDANNRAGCFQWFRPGDSARDCGEAASIAAMTRAAMQRCDSDPGRVFVLGLSAGGAMTVALLAAYPDLFAAGASVAGLPVGTARSALQALTRMAAAGPQRSPGHLATQVRAAAPAGFAGPWPRLSIWQGLADRTVAPTNATLLARQWCALHELAEASALQQVQNGVQHRTWTHPGGRAVRPPVEMWSLPRLAHAYPVDVPRAEPVRFVAQAAVDATAGIARFFGLD
ncbi:extracellular catalytic domain type 1 short-chain-length polyhydroxyalkanoate depolymerase [Rhodopila globiformis]|nr:PHB depolymerase family esterase [Rhodopila globiformis]